MLYFFVLDRMLSTTRRNTVLVKSHFAMAEKWLVDHWEGRLKGNGMISIRRLLFHMAISLECDIPILEACFLTWPQFSRLLIRRYDGKTKVLQRIELFDKTKIPADILKRLYQKQHKFNGYNRAVVGRQPLGMSGSAGLDYIYSQHAKMRKAWLAIVFFRHENTEILDFPRAY
jgi:hypothetical protein